MPVSGRPPQRISRNYIKLSTLGNTRNYMTIKIENSGACKSVWDQLTIFRLSVLHDSVQLNGEAYAKKTQG